MFGENADVNILKQKKIIVVYVFGLKMHGYNVETLVVTNAFSFMFV